MPTGRPPHKPTKESRATVRRLAGFGLPHEDICKLIGIGGKATLHKYYQDDLDVGHAEATSQVAGSLFQQAMNGNVTAQIFWMKTRAGWRETNRIEHTGADGQPIQTETTVTSRDELARQIARLAAEGEETEVPSVTH